MCIFDRREFGYAFIHSTDQKNVVYIQAILPTAANISNQSDAIGVHHSSTSLSAPFYIHAHKQTNVVS